MARDLVVNEIYLSVQGESSFAGFPCVFVRLTGCDLRCSYCDTAYAFTEGKRMAIPAILERVTELANGFRTSPGTTRFPLVELTGGEPLLQSGSLDLMRAVCEAGYTLLLETSGAHDISRVDPRVHRIVDLKCPSSGESGRNRFENMRLLNQGDELKFVIATDEDYRWSKEQLERWKPNCPVLFSWAAPLTEEQRDESLRAGPKAPLLLSRQALAERILADALPVRFQVQLHKVIWKPETRGV